MIALCAGPVSDVDVFWHVEVGAYTLRGHGFPHPDPWAYTLPGVHWHSTSWLSELVLAAAQRSTGWAGVVGLRLVVCVLVTAALARLLLRGRHGWAGPVVFTVIGMPLVFYVQERPQTASLLFLVWLAARLEALLAHGQAPRRWTFVAMSWLWACVHGLFVLAPGVLLLGALGLLLDHGRAALSTVRALVVTSALATAAAAFTPMGPRLLLAPLTVSSAARGIIAEWFPTNIGLPASWGLFGALTLLLLCYSRNSARAPRSELLVVAVLALIGFSAIRNAGPVSILLAPVLLRRMTGTWHTSSTLTLPRKPSLALAALALAAACGSYLQHPALAPLRPARIAAVLASQPKPVRVLNDYNVSGYLISTTHGKARLAVDGRADRYGHAYLTAYTDALNAGKDWEPFIRHLDPDVAVLGKDALTGRLLVVQLGWRRVLVDHEYALFVAPGIDLVAA
ncbi:MAG: hypothetical protein WCD35_00930 [Mycobacteriales bacterium]